MVYAGILGHGMSLTAAECARMIPQLSAISIRHTMHQGGDERRLRPVSTRQGLPAIGGGSGRALLS
jgi:hypothetical protein